MEMIPKETLGLAGEFAVASKLCKRGTMKGGHFEYKDGFRGLNVSPSMIQTYREQWDKIRLLLKLKLAAQSS